MPSLPNGGHIHERSEVGAFSDTPRSVTANGHRITCDDIVLATHNPLVGLGSTAGAALLQTRLALYTSYAIGARVARGRVADALWWDTAEPYRYLRVQPDEDFDVVILGGEITRPGRWRTRATAARSWSVDSGNCSPMPLPSIDGRVR